MKTEAMRLDNAASATGTNEPLPARIDHSAGTRNLTLSGVQDAMARPDLPPFVYLSLTAAFAGQRTGVDGSQL